MNSEELQKWYAALEEADRRAQAGDEQAKQDAVEIANTIKSLESGEENKVQLEEPVVWGAVGAAPATGKLIASGARNIFAPPPAASTAPPPPAAISSSTSPVKVFGLDTSGRAAETSHNVRTAEIAENARKAKQNLEWLQKHGHVPSVEIPGIAGTTEAGVALTHGGLRQVNEPPPKGPLTQRAAQSVMRAAKAAPATSLNIASNLPLRGVASGFASGSLLADASNYRELAKAAAERGDEKAAAYYNSMAIASLGGSATAGVSSLAPRTSPKTRAAAIPAAGLAIYNFLQSQRGYPAPGQAPAEEKAEGGLAHMDRGGSVIKAAKKFAFPKEEMAGLTQISGTIPTYRKADEILNKLGAQGLGMDYGAGLGKGAKVMSGEFQTFEPFHRNKWTPDFTKAEDIPSDAYGRLVNLNVLNVLNPEARAEAVKNIGRVMEPGGTGIVTTRGADVLKALGRRGPEPTSIITSKGTYQKGFTPSELEEYLKYMLGEGYDIRRLGLGPAGAMIEKKAEGGLAHMDRGGSVVEAAKKLFAPKPTKVVRASEALGPHADKYLYVTESDRMRSTGGDLGGPGFSKFQLEDPRYAEAQSVWGVGKKGKASEMLNINKRFPEDKIVWSPLIGSEGQHRSNQHVYDMLTNEFSRQAGAGKLSPELREAMNKRLATWHKYAPLKLQGIDVANPEHLKSMGSTFDKRAAIAEVLGGEGVGGRKGQIFDYPGIMQEMTDPMVVGAPTHSVGTRLFSLSGDVDYRPDLHSAFPYILKGEDKGVAFNAVPKELMLGDWIEQVKDFTGREPGYMEFIRGVKGGHGKPNQFLSQEFLRKLENAGHKEGGLAHMAGGGHATPAWQRKEGQNPEGGLNAKGRASYHAETGGTLKRPQPEGGARRDSFCARMTGMKKKLTSSKTANDPDSRINKSLRKWNC